MNFVPEKQMSLFELMENELQSPRLDMSGGKD